MQFTVGKQTFDLDYMEADSQPRRSFIAALDAANSFAEAKNRIMNDGYLSSTGKAAKLAPLADALWQRIFVSLEAINNERLHLGGREAKLYEIPKISTPYEISMDRERRDFFRTLSSRDKSQVIGQMKSGGDHAEMICSLLRSPVPIGLDMYGRLVEEIHHQNCQSANPDEWESIKSGRQQVESAWRGLMFVVGATNILTEMQSSAVLRMALATGHEQAARLLSDAVTVAETRRLMAAEQQFKAAA